MTVSLLESRRIGGGESQERSSGSGATRKETQKTQRPYLKNVVINQQTKPSPPIVIMDLTEDSKPTSPRAGNHFFLDLTDSTSSQDNEFCPQESVDNKLKMSFVDLCGQVMSDGLFLKLKMNPEEYEREMKVGIQKTLQETCQIPGSFRNQQNFVEFESHLESSLNLLQQKSLLEVVEECGGGDEDLKFAKKRCRKEIEERESEKKKKMQQIEDDRTCIICLDHPRTHLIMPCFHFIACSDCIQNFAVGSECPVCRTRVMETKQVFTS